MSSTRDPNRFAHGLEAVSVRTRIANEEAELALIRQNVHGADEAAEDAKARCAAAEAAHLLQKHLLDDANAYLQLVQRKEAAQIDVVAAQRAFLHPVRETPLELLGRIFEACLEHHGLGSPLLLFDGESVSRRQRQPFQLAAVCRRWREASLATPRAWGYVEIKLDQLRAITLDQWIRYLDISLQRSRSAPISIRLARSRKSKDCDSTLIDKLIQAMPRCTAVSVDVHAFERDDRLLPFLTTSAPNLRHADLNLDEEATDSVLKELRLFPDAVRLNSLRSYGFFREGATTFPSLEHAVMAYAKSHTRRDDTLHLFRSSPRLTQVVLMDLVVGDVDTVHRQPCVAGSVRHLRLHMTESTRLEDVFNLVTFPRLEILELSGNAEFAACRVALLPGIAQTSPNVTTLDARAISSAALPTLLNALSALPKLVMLRIPTCVFASVDLGLVVDTLGRVPWRCPVLRELDFDDSTFDVSCTAEEMLRLVRVRIRASAEREGPALLKVVRVGYWQHEQASPLQNEIYELLAAAHKAADEGPEDNAAESTSTPAV